MRVARWIVRLTTVYVLVSFIGGIYYFPETVNGGDYFYFAGFMGLALWTDSLLSD